jgi:polyribonucleotide nucleotidyltransferase
MTISTQEELKMYKSYEMQLAGRTLRIEIGRVAELANGECIVRYGDTVVLVTATASEKPRAGIDFFPLSIDYEEKMYSVGKIPGSFNRREGRPSEKAILTARVIDRPIRPLFPKDYRNDVCINAAVMSVDQDCAPEICAMIGSSIALSISDIPFYGPTGSVSVGMIDGEFVINPTAEQRAVSKLNLTVASTKEKVMMIEAGADEVSDEDMYNAIMFGHAQNVEICKFIDGIVAELGKEKHSYEEHVVDHDFYDAIKALITDPRMEEAVFTDMKQIRDERITAITNEVIEKLASFKTEDEDDEAFAARADEAIYKYEKKNRKTYDFKRP